MHKVVTDLHDSKLSQKKTENVVAQFTGGDEVNLKINQFVSGN